MKKAWQGRCNWENYCIFVTKVSCQKKENISITTLVRGQKLYSLQCIELLSIVLSKTSATVYLVEKCQVTVFVKCVVRDVKSHENIRKMLQDTNKYLHSKYRHLETITSAMKNKPTCNNCLVASN